MSVYIVTFAKEGGGGTPPVPFEPSRTTERWFFLLGDSSDCRQSTFNAHNALFLYWRLAFRPLEAFPLPPIQKSAIGRLLDGLTANIIHSSGLGPVKKEPADYS